jgi:hypothetical protein
MEFEVPKNLILRPTLSINMVQRVLWGERQKRCSGKKEEARAHGKGILLFIMIFLRERRRRQEKTKELSTMYFIYFKLPFLDMYFVKKSICSFFWCMVTPFGQHSVYT